VLPGALLTTLLTASRSPAVATAGFTELAAMLERRAAFEDAGGGELDAPLASSIRDVNMLLICEPGATLIFLALVGRVDVGLGRDMLEVVAVLEDIS
jgi:hypothetical protein